MTTASTSNLTQSQLLIWTGQLLNPSEPLYNMALAFELDTTLETERFQQAFQTLVDTTDALRTVFEDRSGVPMQNVLETFRYDVAVVDATPWSAAEYQAWKTEKARRIFDLSHPPFESVLLRLANNRWCWFLNQHHLITDGWSVMVVYQKMAQLYAENSVESFQYSDYRSYEFNARSRREGTFWSEQLKSLPVPPGLYGNCTAGDTSANLRHTLQLGPERSDRLRELTAEPDLRAWTEHLSLFNMFATVLLAFVHRVSGQENLAIGTPAHNRATPAFKKTAGLFIELFPLAATIAPDERFNTLFAKVQQSAFEFLKHAQAGAASAELSRSFNVVLNYINASFGNFGDAPMQSDWVHPNHVDPAHVFRLQVHDFDGTGNITLHFDLNTSTFSKEQQAAIPSQFLALLDAFIADRTQPVAQPALTQFANAANKPWPHSTLPIGVAATPSDIALECNGTQLTYETFNTQINQLAQLLAQRGIQEDSRVALHLKRSPEFVVAVCALLKLGACFVPLDTTFGAARIHAMIQDCAPHLIVTSNALVAGIDTTAPIATVEECWAQLPGFTGVWDAPLVFDEALAYILYTSGSTGKPKGVMISRYAMFQYLQAAQELYLHSGTREVIPLFSAIGFDLTITSLLLPFVSGNTSVIYPEPDSGPDLAVLDVVRENKATFIKLTPAHLALLGKGQLSNSNLKTMVVGGEDFKASLARAVQAEVGSALRIFNEYGPTEATVGCIVQQYNGQQHAGMPSVPIGLPMQHVAAWILDSAGNAVPDGVAGELYVGGTALANGYWNQPELTSAAFVQLPGLIDQQVYRTGDLVRSNHQGAYEFLGRLDEQVKIGGRRIELAEIEHFVNAFDGIQSSVVDLRTTRRAHGHTEPDNCTSCGLPSNFPNVDFDAQGVCSLCRSYESYQHQVRKYFRTLDDLKAHFGQRKPNQDYDCIALLSGGKDSTYAVAKLVDMGLKVLAFTLDNGYISDQAKANIARVVADLGIDHVYGTTPAMNEIFVDSLQRHCNVCDGCFKTIYTLSTQLALQKNIPYIVTGLSRGQFFETRLSGELFQADHIDVEHIDSIILNARKVYHRADDAVKRLLDVSAFEKDDVFDKVQFLDFYRYTDVHLDEMLRFLDEKVSWVRPDDTGRSTNCLINQAGIFVHKKERGYSNYSFPYSWDVRLGHKNRAAALEEINEEIDEQEVQRMLDEIGYSKAEAAREQHLVAYYTAKSEVNERDLREYLLARLPDFMVPVQFIRMETMPLSSNGKIDKSALPLPDNIRPVTASTYVAPRSDIESMLVDIWSEVLNIERIGIYDKFLELGGNSLAAIRIISRANDAFQLELPLNLAFNKPTIAAFAEYVRETIVALLAQMDAEE